MPSTIRLITALCTLLFLMSVRTYLDSYENHQTHVSSPGLNADKKLPSVPDDTYEISILEPAKPSTSLNP